MAGSPETEPRASTAEPSNLQTDERYWRERRILPRNLNEAYKEGSAHASSSNSHIRYFCVGCGACCTLDGSSAGCPARWRRTTRSGRQNGKTDAASTKAVGRYAE